MASIKPFRGFLYNREKIENLELVVAPPYDVITSEQQTSYYQKHPCNVIRLILGKEEPSDDERENKYTRAARYLSTWQQDNILIRNSKPSIYFYTQDFILPDEASRRRKGFVCLIKLEEFSSGVVFPHEKTLSKPKTDRLKLMLACGANFNPVFSLYSDPELNIEDAIDAVGETSPYLDIKDENDVRHKLWSVDNLEIIEQLKEVMKDKTLLIADGHHRYETALNYRNLMRQKYPGYTGDEPFNYTMMYFTNMNDAGLIVLPTHRLVKNIDFNPSEFVKKAQKYCEVETVSASLETKDSQVRKKIMVAMKNEATERYLFGMCSKREDRYFIFRLRDFSLLDELLGRGTSSALRNLDANIMEVLVFQTLLGISCSDPQHEEKIKFVHSDEEAVNMVKSGEYEVAFLVNPTRIEQVQAVATQGEVMPQKSTYFYPKLLSGVVINQMNLEERVV